ncbi:MAG: hypothetical protein U1E03_01595 [Hyphomonadaceae bacterium]
MIRSITFVTAAALAVSTPAFAQHQHEPVAQTEPRHQHEPAPAPAPQPAPHDPSMHQGMDHAEHGMDHEQHMMGAAMTGVLGPYGMSRDASGTAWQPDVSEHGGIHSMHGEWMVMSHLMLNGVYDWQDGPRGDDKAFLAGMIMGSARRDIGANGTLNLRAMLSPDPLMGASGYPLLFAAGETANGADTLVDRQHPHDLFMELAASYAHELTPYSSVFIYGGLPGEPAFGPPAFMHRLSAMDSPEAPITHHWFDSTHITFGVLTVGYVVGDWKFEGSRFRGREPDEHRYDIESGDLDSSALRVSWNPTRNLALQASWADITSPEALHADEDEERWSVSGIYTRELGEEGWWSTTLAFANKERTDGASLDAWLAEAALHPNDRWTLFARGESVETDELGAPHGPAETVARLSVGAIRDWRINDNAVFGVGALVQTHLAPSALEPSYGGDPEGGMAFVRLKIG